MNVVRFVKGQIKSLLARAQLAQTLLKSFDLKFLPYNEASWPKSLVDPTAYYLNCVRYFHQAAPVWLREHRRYFCQSQRGFGENAFHVMWHALSQTCRPRSFLEIGVFRGQVISLVALIARSFDSDCLIWGVSPFSSAADSVSKYASSVDFLGDTLNNFKAFDLPAPTLIRGMSNETGVVEKFSARRWDLVYIDGNHDYEFAKEDFINCGKILNPGGKIILDDSALYTSYRPPLYATAGHPGPSRLGNQAKSFGFKEILQVGHNRIFQRMD